VRLDFNRGGKPCASLRSAPARKSGTSILSLIAGRRSAGSRGCWSPSGTAPANPLLAAGCDASVIRCSSRSNAAGRFAVVACSPVVGPLTAVVFADAVVLLTAVVCFAAVRLNAVNAAARLSADRFAAVAIAVTGSSAERVRSRQSKPFSWRRPSRASWRGCNRSIGRSSTDTECRRAWDCFSTPRSDDVGRPRAPRNRTQRTALTHRNGRGVLNGQRLRGGRIV
jgi:hypothetical protein